MSVKESVYLIQISLDLLNFVLILWSNTRSSFKFRDIHNIRGSVVSNIGLHVLYTRYDSVAHLVNSTYNLMIY